jgi:hypothetical protein
MIAISCITLLKAVLFFPKKILDSFFFDKTFIAQGLLLSSVLRQSFTLPKLPLPISLTTMY